MLIDLKNIAIFTDYFIICSGTSDRMINALANSVVEFVHEKYKLAVSKEGQPSDGWMLLDIGEVIIHIFSPEQRRYYRLEDLWSQGKILVHLQ